MPPAPTFSSAFMSFEKLVLSSPNHWHRQALHRSVRGQDLERGLDVILHIVPVPEAY